MNMTRKDFLIELWMLAGVREIPWWLQPLPPIE